MSDDGGRAQTSVVSDADIIGEHEADPINTKASLTPKCDPIIVINSPPAREHSVNKTIQTNNENKYT